MKRLPATVEDLAGARAARWIRESTPGQFDRYGPEAQSEFQDRAIARLGLIDSGLAWRAAHSGRTVYRSAEMAAMLGSAQRGEFDVLLVGYVSRWQRNLRRTLELLEDTLHPAGVPVYFCDEEILTSSERHWEPARRRGQGRRALQPPPVAPDPRGLCQQAGEGARSWGSFKREARIGHRSAWPGSRSPRCPRMVRGDRWTAKVRDRSRS